MMKGIVRKILKTMGIYVSLKSKSKSKDQGSEYKNLVDEFRDAQGSYSSTF
jgi:hypothetical protein